MVHAARRSVTVCMLIAVITSQGSVTVYLATWAKIVSKVSLYMIVLLFNFHLINI